MPIILSLALSLVFGTLFSETPKLGIVDEGDSGMMQRAKVLDTAIVKEYPSVTQLKAAVRAGSVDMGVLLPQGFDSLVHQGQGAELSVYIWGESLAKNRVILETTLSNLIVDLAGQEAPVEIATTTLGDPEEIALGDRLLPLIIIMAIVMGGSLIPASSLVDEKHNRTLTALTITPTSLLDVLLSKGLAGIIVSIFTALVILTLNQAFGGQPALLLMVLALSGTAAAGFGILLGTLTKDVTSLFATVKAIGILLYAPGILYLFPDIPQWIAKLFPTYYIVQPVIEITQQGGVWRDVAPEVAVLLGLIVALVSMVTVAASRTQLRPA
jgi:ABC-2 type transport system permease protein